MGHHYEHDNLIGMDRETRRELESKYIERAHQMAREAGRKEFL
jgi:hypothetical protein